MTLEMEVMPRIAALVEACLDDPEFDGGSTHIATAQLTNPTVKEFTYTAELYLGITKVVSSSGQVTIPAGSTLPVQFTIVTPIVEGVYQVFLDIWVGAVLLEHYQAADVTIAISPAVDIGDITWT